MSRDLLIGLAGRAGSGKDTAADYLCQAHGFLRHAFAEPIRDMLSALFAGAGIDERWMTERALKEKPIPGLPGDASYRHWAQDLGTLGRRRHEDIWILLAGRELGLDADLAKSAPVHDRIVITDVRFPNEVHVIREYWRGRVWRIERPQAAPVCAHESERLALEHDASIDNRGSVAALCDQLDGLVRALERTAA